MHKRTDLEFFAGRHCAGLGKSWRCLFANDFDKMKVETYRANWGREDIRHKDLASVRLPDLLPTHAIS
jgi:DNA (cytosine-5)-methyltransferase 1